MEIYIKDERERANAEERKKLFAACNQNSAKTAAAAAKGGAGKAAGKTSPNPKAKAAGKSLACYYYNANLRGKSEPCRRGENCNFVHLKLADADFEKMTPPRGAEEKQRERR